MKLSLKVVPGSCADEIAGWLGDSLKIRVRAPAESGKANAAVTEILAATLGVHKRAVSIFSGASSARKIVEIDDLTVAEFRARLADKFG